MSLLIGQHINKVFSQDAEVQRIFGTRTYAGYSDNATMPYAVYRRTGSTPTGTKDGVTGEVVNVEVAIFAESYNASIAGAEAVRRALVGKTGRYDTFDVTRCEMTPSGEDLTADDMAQILVFSFKTRYK